MAATAPVFCEEKRKIRVGQRRADCIEVVDRAVARERSGERGAGPEEVSNRVPPLVHVQPAHDDAAGVERSRRRQAVRERASALHRRGGAVVRARGCGARRVGARGSGSGPASPGSAATATATAATHGRPSVLTGARQARGAAGRSDQQQNSTPPAAKHETILGRPHGTLLRFTRGNDSATCARRRGTRHPCRHATSARPQLTRFAEPCSLRLPCERCERGGRGSRLFDARDTCDSRARESVTKGSNTVEVLQYTRPLDGGGFGSGRCSNHVAVLRLQWNQRLRDVSAGSRRFLGRSTRRREPIPATSAACMG